MRDGAIKLAFHIREVMEQHKDFVLIKVDKKNAFNEIKRASVVRALAKMPGFEAFARFAFLHLDPVSDIVAGTSKLLLPGLHLHSGL